MPVEIPDGVQVNIKGSNVHVKGPKGELKRTFSPLIKIHQEGNTINVERKSEIGYRNAGLEEHFRMCIYYRYGRHRLVCERGVL